MLQSHEIEALHARMQATHDQHVSEMQATRMQLDQVKGSGGGSGDQRALVAQLNKENKQLKEAAAAAAANQ